MIQLSRVESDENTKRRFSNAVSTATTYPERDRLSNPGVVEKLTDNSFRVTGREGDEYFVRILKSDGETFIHCTCDGGKNGVPCYHAAHVALSQALVLSVGGQVAVLPDFEKLAAELTEMLKPEPIVQVIRPGDTLTLQPGEGEFRVTIEPVV
jgi:hypothetical protein